jgi:zinc finger protein CreA/MIG
MRYPYHCCSHHHLSYNHSGYNACSSCGRLNRLSSRTKPRLYSHEDDRYSHLYVKSFQFDSPSLTTLSSPTFSNESILPALNNISLVTPAPLPDPRSYHCCYVLPTLWNLSLQHPPTLAPIEPQNFSGPYQARGQANSVPKNGLTITDILSRADGKQRKLPLPWVRKLLVQDLNIFFQLRSFYKLRMASHPIRTLEECLISSSNVLQQGSIAAA